MTQRVDRGLEQGTAFGIELPTEDEHTAIGLIAVQPALQVGVIGIGEHAVGIDGEARGLGGSPHAAGIERLRRGQQDVFVPLHLLHADGSSEVSDHGDIGEGGPTRTRTVERGRHLAERPGQMDAIRRRFRSHPAGASQPGHRGAAAIGLCTAISMKAVQATQALSLQSIDREPDLDDVGAQFGRRDTVDGLIDECVSSVTQTRSRVRECVRCHAYILPNICSLTASAGPNTDI